MASHNLFDRRRLELRDLGGRGNDFTVHGGDVSMSVGRTEGLRDVESVCRSVVEARARGRPVVAISGGHPVKLGLSRIVVDLISRGWITHVATNGSGIIHDFELALSGGTSEDVSKWIKVGQFGLWRETGALNDVFREAADRGEGLGEGVGRYIEEHMFPHRDVSIAAAGWRCGVPVTCHVTIGADIIHAMPNCDGAALGQTSYTDFLIFAQSVSQLEGGVFLNIGSAVTGPEVYLKALSMARNVARQEGREIKNFTTAVFDLVPLPDNWREGPPGKDHHMYYYRPWKTILIRTVADGGKSYYICGDHRDTIPALWHLLTSSTPDGRAPGSAAAESSNLVDGGAK